MAAPPWLAGVVFSHGVSILLRVLTLCRHNVCYGFRLLDYGGSSALLPLPLYRGLLVVTSVGAKSVDDDLYPLTTTVIIFVGLCGVSPVTHLSACSDGHDHLCAFVVFLMRPNFCGFQSRMEATHLIWSYLAAPSWEPVSGRFRSRTIHLWRSSLSHTSTSWRSSLISRVLSTSCTICESA